MKIILFGARGWIGLQILKLLQQEPNFNVICPVERADNVVDVARLLDTEQPNRVISIIGRTRGPGIGTIDYLEDSDKSHDKLTLNMRDNLYAPLSLAIACQSRGIHFCYLGTGCIFSYSDEKTIFDEDDEPNFFGSGYSVVKGYTDRLMHQFPNVLQARIRMPLTPDKSPFNFITKITSYDKICSFENSMTVLPTLLPLLVDMIKQGTCGTINLTNPGTICHDRILTLYKEIVDPDFTWKNFTIKEQDAILLSKRSNNHLCSRKLESMYPDVPSIEDAVITCLKEIAKTRST